MVSRGGVVSSSLCVRSGCVTAIRYKKEDTIDTDLNRSTTVCVYCGFSGVVSVTKVLTDVYLVDSISFMGGVDYYYVSTYFTVRVVTARNGGNPNGFNGGRYSVFLGGVTVNGFCGNCVVSTVV